MTDSGDRAGTYTLEEILSQPPTWKRCLAALDESGELRRLAAPLSRDGECLFVGCGSSFYLGLIAAATWTLLTGEPARAVPASEILLFPGLLSRRFRAILVSRSGRTSEMIEAGDYLKRLDQTASLAITCGTRTPIEEVASRTIRLPEGDEGSTVMTRSFTSMLLALQMLAGERANARDFLNQIRTLPGEMESRIEGIDSLIRRLVDSRAFEDYVFLGQGPFYGVAQEAMLKIKEMSCSYAQCFHTLEFRHGPKAIVSARTLITFFLSESGFESEVSVLEEMKDLGATTLVVANQASAAVRRSADSLIELSLPVAELARPAAFIVPAQLLGFHTGVRKGLDPDKPRYLSRVVMLENTDGDSGRGAP
ncbi:MAG TPA: SIS domain-containing protein [Candidatus Cybelea sp.]|nr:SIS domain-containing protein [Candidatus Cybelea sp.]